MGKRRDRERAMRLGQFPPLWHIKKPSQSRTSLPRWSPGTGQPPGLPWRRLTHPPKTAQQSLCPASSQSLFSSARLPLSSSSAQAELRHVPSHIASAKFIITERFPKPRPALKPARPQGPSRCPWTSGISRTPRPRCSSTSRPQRSAARRERAGGRRRSASSIATLFATRRTLEMACA